MAELNGVPASLDEVRSLALTNYGHFTTMRVEDQRVRGLGLHMQRLVRDCREVFDTDLEPDHVRQFVRHALAATRPRVEPDQVDASLEVWARELPDLDLGGVDVCHQHERERAQQTNNAADRARRHRAAGRAHRHQRRAQAERPLQPVHHAAGGVGGAVVGVGEVVVGGENGLGLQQPFRPEARGQSRGNSGLYLANRYEVQILDSFGLDGKSNECGGIYQRLAPKVNMCLPPLQWQTFDIDFTKAVADASGQKVSATRLTARLNGVLIHDDVEVPGPTGGARGKDEGTPDVLRLQGHRNFVQFRNLWLVEKK